MLIDLKVLRELAEKATPSTGTMDRRCVRCSCVS
jgi:hypothetical protein